jgi:tetratricopeptide (TPR) repeat protein
VLDGKRTTPAPPGADQELKKAVIAIDEGAKADSRYAQALDLLKAGKPSEAEPLLKAVAEDKVESATNANKDAAAAYRNLASIAAVSSPGRARDYFAKAAQLDPDNVEGVFWNGWYQFEAGKLDVAQAAYERVVSKAGVRDTGWVFWARNGLGNILMSRGDLSGALKYYKDGLAIADSLAKSDPGNAGWQRDLSVSFERIGDVQKAQGDLSGALGSYSDSLAIRDKLAKSDPGNAGWQRDLSVSFNKIGDMQKAQGDLSGALGSYRDSLAIADKLTKSDRGNAGWQRDLSVSFNKIGDVQVAQGDLSGALGSYRDSLAIRDKLAKSDPGNAGWQHDLSVSFVKLATVLKEQNDKAKALGSLRQGRDIILHLTERSPENVVWKQDLNWFDTQINELTR